MALLDQWVNNFFNQGCIRVFLIFLMLTDFFVSAVFLQF